MSPDAEATFHRALCTLANQVIRASDGPPFHQERRPTRVCRTPGADSDLLAEASTLGARMLGGDRIASAIDSSIPTANLLTLQMISKSYAASSGCGSRWDTWGRALTTRPRRSLGARSVDLVMSADVRPAGVSA